MKNYQMRLSDEVHTTLKEIAEERGVSIADLMRESLELFVIADIYAKEGKRLFWEDTDNGTRAEVLLPGFTLRRMRDRERRGAILAARG